MAQGTSTTTSIPFANTLTRRYDGASSVTQYAGYAYSGASESDSVWSITRLTISDSGSVTSINIPNVAWSNRYNVFAFDFIFNQQWASNNITLSAIGGFSSTPNFTARSGLFTFSSVGSSTGLITFSFTATSNVTVTITADLTQNGTVLQTIVDTLGVSPVTFTYSPISVALNDTIQITTYIGD